MRIAIVFAAIALAASCATTATTASAPEADADDVKAEKDRTACRKMCEMAGSTEGNGEAVADCQAKCDGKTANDDSVTPAP